MERNAYSTALILAQESQPISTMWAELELWFDTTGTMRTEPSFRLFSLFAKTSGRTHIDIRSGTLEENRSEGRGNCILTTTQVKLWRWRYHGAHVKTCILNRIWLCRKWRVTTEAIEATKTPAEATETTVAAVSTIGQHAGTIIYVDEMRFSISSRVSFEISFFLLILLLLLLRLVLIVMLLLSCLVLLAACKILRFSALLLL